MSGTRRSTRATTSTINVKLNEQNEIEYFKVENDGTEEDDDDIIADPDHLNMGNGEFDEEAEDDEEAAEDEEEEEEQEEELIVNADGTMSIRIPQIKPKPKKVPIHHICAKCSKVLLSSAVSDHDLRNFLHFIVNTNLIKFVCIQTGAENSFESV